MAEASDTGNERAQRMKALQMADLGTARREHISTVDRPNKLHRIGIRQIEATRDSNRKGTEAYNLAETNREKLNSWATYHETLEENIDAENLEPLLDGQTHRMALEARIKGTNLDYPVSASRGKKATRGALHSGRGGGFAGTRGRGGTTHYPNTRSGDITRSDPNRLSPPSIPTANKAALAPLPQKPLDPSKDCNNPPTFRGRADKKRYGVSRNVPPVTKARRPVFAAPPSINFESLLADGDDFMAAVTGVQFATVAKPAQSPTPSKATEAPIKDLDVSPVPPMSQGCPESSTDLPKDATETSPQRTQSEVKVAAPFKPKVGAAASATNLMPVAPLRIDVFTNPSEIRNSQGADAVPLKTDHGFGSYLPQPQHPTGTDDHDADDLFLCASPEAPAAAHIEKDNYKTKGSNVGTSLLDISDGPEDTIPLAIRSVPKTEQPQRDESKDESNALKEKLAKLTKILLDQSLLDPDVIVYLQERKERLEKELAEKELISHPEILKAPNHTTEPGNTKHIQPGPPNPGAPVAAQNAPPTVNLLSDTTNGNAGEPVNLRSSQNAKSEPNPVEVKNPSVQKSAGDSVGQTAIHATPQGPTTKTQTTSIKEVPLIIGDHLLPGRPMKKSEPPRPTAPAYEPKEQHHFTFSHALTFPGNLNHNSNQSSTFNQGAQCNEPVAFTYRPTSCGTAPMAASNMGNQSVNIMHITPTAHVSPVGPAGSNAPKSRFKMRDTPQFPISAATMQYYSGSLLGEQIKPLTSPIRKTNENISPAMNFASPQPIEPDQKSSGHSRNQSSSLSPVASTFRPVSQNRSPIPAAFGATHTGRTTTNHHSRFSSTTSETFPEPKSIFVAEMAKRGVSVSGAPANSALVERKRSGMEGSKYAH
ncbi:hypothetical protein MGYG_01758 [Nannizzia gypsea CBS 118893]|uniref:Ataxin-2 C-terminal domain-containing protein n=1 Tax=Arthroderma gypseum (strain ATCC MYA-4604 / CBS 118893) TaxID=535722 RepID=E5R336_ARTGP|nr:hypothetical protein MGYG_01758 [Nannizzia gypsea CBS 118893]EFQ98740.1 hypothetical protein MGYG_01758 [Nannizzia gypsea CBS 118893]